MEKQANRWSMEPLNENETKFKVKHIYNPKGESSDETLFETEEECTQPMFVCYLNKQNGGVQEIFATFYTGERIFSSQTTAYDYELVKPNKPFKAKDSSKLYDDIYSRMKHANGDMIHHLKWENEADKNEYLNHCEQYKSDSHKEQWVNGLLWDLLQFEQARPKIKHFILDFLCEHEQYKYVRIFHNGERPSSSKIIKS